ncbi:TauD/TfdA family dioxygenase [Brenneria corticis]|uniref:TauD/TfdA-like domain-containing protein n=1 Tax=Brenneria corticis TaxID=2173106 RepID=A0A2U1TLI7_9GAMM|nr:hypothetical protein DDT56_22380 [Brenneria sp. CFCC 11842]
MRAALQRVAITKHWKPGDLVVFSNLRCVHGRGEIKGRRWLQRCYGSYMVTAGTVLWLNE